jgi:hypothetical protein
VSNHVPTIAYEEPLGREARIARDGDDNPIGVALFFTPEELVAIGIDLETTETVTLRIVNGEVLIEPIEPNGI